SPSAADPSIAAARRENAASALRAGQSRTELRKELAARERREKSTRAILAAMDAEIRITGEPSRTGDRCAFIVDRPPFAGGSAHFGDAERAAASPLAQELLAIPGVDSVLIADNTVTVSVAHAVDWPALGIGNVIRKHVRSGQPIVSDDYFRDMPAEGDLK